MPWVASGVVEDRTIGVAESYVEFVKVGERFVTPELPELVLSWRTIGGESAACCIFSQLMGAAVAHEMEMTCQGIREELDKM